MNWMRKALNTVVPKCRPGRQLGRHGEVIHGLGGMGDAELCLRCSLEFYPTFSPSMKHNCETYREVNSPDDWPAISAARLAPGGLDHD